MFAVGRAKEHVYSLATQLLGEQGHTHSHHHHHHHARQLSTSATGSCLSPSHQPHQPPPSALPTLTLEDVSLFRMQEFRLLFLARCCQLHALAGKAHLVVGSTAFETLMDVLRVILREANNDGDFLSCRLVYALSDMVATYAAGLHLQSARTALRKHEAWTNPDVYRVTLEECVARDKQQWLGLQGPLQELLGLDGGSVRGEDVIRLLLLLRLRAIAEAIVQLRSEHETLIQGLLDHCREAYGQAFSLDEVTGAPSTPAMLWLLDAAAHFFDGTANGQASSSDSSSSGSPHAGFNMAEESSGQFGKLRRGVSSSAIPNVLRWASETARAASHWACLGFSVHHALLHHVVGQVAATSAITKGPLAPHPPPPTAGGGPGLATAAAAAAGLGAGVCLCGKPFYPEWRVLGGYGPETERLRQLAPSLLCEPCFRSLLREQPLHDGKTTTHRPPQAVGCAPLPAAAEIRAPQSVVALAAAAAATPSTASSPHPEVQPPRPLSTTTTVVVGLTDAEQSQLPQAPLPLPPPPPPAQVQRQLSSSSASGSAASPNPPAPRPPSVSKDAGTLEREGSSASSMRRRSISGSSRVGDASIAPPPAPPRPKSTRDRSSTHHLGGSAGGGGGGGGGDSNNNNPRLSVSGSGSSGGGKEGRARLRKSELMALLMSGELEVLKHVQARFAGFGMAAAPHPRILFVDSSSTESAELLWCSKEEFAKRQWAGKKGTMRGGLPLKHLLDVRRGEGAGKDRIVTLLFQERPLVVEAHTDERADLIEAVFRMVLNKNRKMTMGK